MSTSHCAAYGKRTYPGYLETLISVQQEYKPSHFPGTLASVKNHSQNITEQQFGYSVEQARTKSLPVRNLVVIISKSIT